MPLEKVLGIMKNDAGTHFDPELIELFLENLDEFLKIKETYQDDNSVHTIMDIIKDIKS
jgi:HD-GYP domain-containing protein (c-di-GMP phosphodiesterase class II)